MSISNKIEMLIRKFVNNFRRNLIIYEYFEKFLKNIYRKFKSMKIFQKEKIKKICDISKTKLAK